MSLIKTPLEKATAAVEAGERLVGSFEAELATVTARLNSPESADSVFDLLENKSSLERRVTDARSAVDHLRGHLAIETEKARVAGIRADLDDLRRRTAKLSRTLETRYQSAAATFAAVLAEMRANADEWERLNPMARAEGLPGGDDAERQLRANIGLTPSMGGFGGHFQTLTEVDVLGWSGRPLFEGTPNRSRAA